MGPEARGSGRLRRRGGMQLREFLADGPADGYNTARIFAKDRPK